MSNTRENFRKTIQMCQTCFNQGRIAGQAFRAFTCAICLKEKNHPNTNIPKVCKECAIDKNCCSWCQKEMD